MAATIQSANIIRRNLLIKPFHPESRVPSRLRAFSQRKQTTRTPWTPEEDAILIDLRTKTNSWDEAVSALPHRSVGSLRGRYFLIAPRSEDGRLLQYWGPRPRYTAKDDQLVQDLRETRTPYSVMQDKLPQRTSVGLKSRYNGALQPRMTLGTAKKKFKWWNESDDDKLISLRGKEHLAWGEIAAKLGRTATGVKNRYNALMRGRKEKPELLPYGAFTAEEDEKIVKLYEDGLTKPEMMAHFPTRTLKSIERRIHVLRPRLEYRRPPIPHDSRLGLGREIVALRDQGHPWKVITEKTGKARSTLGRYEKAARSAAATSPSAVSRDESGRTEVEVDS